MARPSNTSGRREQIARALLKVMARRGYDGASIGEVAREAGVAQGLVHYYFEDKRAILLRAIEELGVRHEARLAAASAGAGCGAEAQLEAFLGAHLGVDGGDPEGVACWVMVSGEALRERQVGRALEGVLARTREQLRGVLEAGVREGVWAVEDVDGAVAALLAALQGYLVLSVASPGWIPAGSALPSVRRMARGLLGQGAVR